MKNIKNKKVLTKVENMQMETGQKRVTSIQYLHINPID